MWTVSISTMEPSRTRRSSGSISSNQLAVCCHSRRWWTEFCTSPRECPEKRIPVHPGDSTSHQRSSHASGDRSPFRELPRQNGLASAQQPASGRQTDSDAKSGCAARGTPQGDRSPGPDPSGGYIPHRHGTKEAQTQVTRSRGGCSDRQPKMSPVSRGSRTLPTKSEPGCGYSIGERSSGAVTSCLTPCDFVSSNTLPASPQRWRELTSSRAHCGRTLHVTCAGEQVLWS